MERSPSTERLAEGGPPLRRLLWKSAPAVSGEQAQAGAKAQECFSASGR